MATKATAKKTARNATASKVNPDTIVSNINDRSGAHIVVTSAGGATISYPRYGDDGQRRKLSAKGGNIKALQADLAARPPVKPQARLATGVDRHNSPHSAKAIADQKRAEKPAKGGAAKAAAPKAGKNKAPARGADRDYSKGSTPIKAAAGSWRHHMLITITKYSNTAKAKAAHEKSNKFSGNKLDFNWAAAQGYINWAK